MHKTFNMSVFQGNKNTTLKSLRIFFRPYLRIAASGIDRSREDLSGCCYQLLLLVSSYSYIEPVRSCCNFRLFGNYSLIMVYRSQKTVVPLSFEWKCAFPDTNLLSPVALTEMWRLQLGQPGFKLFFFPLKFDFLVLGGRPHHTRV